LGRIREQPIGLLVGARSGEPGVAGLLTQIATEPAVTMIELAPLSADAVTSLVRERRPPADDGFCRRCWELTAGNPLAVRAVPAAIAGRAGANAGGTDRVAARAAGSLSRSVLRRLAALPTDARELAEAVAVFERGVELQRAAALAELQPAAALAAADE